MKSLVVARPRGLVVVRAQASPAPQQRPQQPSNPLRMSTLALAVEGPGSGRRRFPDPFEASPSSAAAAAAPPSSATSQKAEAKKDQSGSHPCLSTKDAYSSFSRVAGPPIAAELLAAAAAGPPLSAAAVAEVAGGPSSGRRVRPPPSAAAEANDSRGEGSGSALPFPPRVPAAAGREESSEALLREVRARHGGC